MKSLRIAIVNYKSIDGVSYGQTKAVETIARSVNAMENVQLQLFSLGRKNIKSTVFENISQTVIDSAPYKEEGFSASRILDFSSLFLFGFKLNLERLNDNAMLYHSLKEFGPDIVITVTSNLYRFIEHYKAVNKSVKIISYMDSPRLIDDSLLALTNLNVSKTLQRVLKKLIKPRYINYYIKSYFRLAKCSDAIVVASDQDKKELIGVLGSEFAFRTFAIPPVIIERSSAFTNPVMDSSRKLRKILFLGAYSYYPNREAVELIKSKIAPKLLDKEFVIIGKGAPKQRIGNVNIVGEVKNVKQVIRDADICIAPLMHGSGMKQKILAYFQENKPVIGTSLAFNGYAVKNKSNCIVEDDVDKFYLKIKELENNRKLLAKLIKNSAKICDDFLYSNIKDRWEKVVQSSITRHMAD